jgi:putative flippase GtrA
VPNRARPLTARSRFWKHHPVSLIPVGERWHHLVTEIGRFMAVGGIATFVSFLIFNFLVHGLYLTSDPWLNGHPVTAFIAANLVGMVISYRLSRSWTFRHRPPVHADGGRTAYFVINSATMVIPIACLMLTRRVFGLDDPLSDNLSGNVVGQLLGQMARFYLFRTYVFQKPQGESVATVSPRAGDATGPSTRDRVPPSGP